VVSNDVWVLDGNFSRTTDIKWEKADTVIWLDFSYLTTFSQLLGRTIKRAIQKDELWPNTGNKESFRKSFFHKSSILMWFFKNYGRNKERYNNVMQSHEHSHLNFVRLKNRKEAREFIENTRNKLSQQDAQKARASA
jgi:adenylate kinase family enzyme